MTTQAAQLIESIKQTRGHLQRDAAQHSRLRALQQWQSQRLLNTYGDYHRQPRYRDALDFFVNDLYGPHDFSSRDGQLKQVIDSWERLLPRRALQAVTNALDLEALTQTLDAAMLQSLADESLDQSTYANAYRHVGRRDERKRQIALIIQCGRDLEAVVQSGVVRAALRIARLPAKLSGVLALHSFLERGFAAFLKMNGAQKLLRVVEQREHTIMENLFAGVANPFVADARRHKVDRTNSEHS